MPKRTDIRSIAIIGAGPIVIGQACEFDYSGTQACKALKAEGYRIILINSNPATIMTDPDLADATYIEPITPEIVAKVLERERPDALLPTMGGQTALNTALALAEDGTLDRLGIELIGANREAIAKAEDRQQFRKAMEAIGLEIPKSVVVGSLADARAALEELGLPAIIRPSFTLGGAGGGIAYNRLEFEQIILEGLDASPTTSVQIDESLLGWKEYEMEVVRDKADNGIIICSIENLDSMGVHTGDSVTVAPALTLTDKEFQRMRDASLAVLREIGVETGGSNVQFAVHPKTGRMVVIEMNPRVSRSSALASKATGFPIAKIAAKLAVGYTLDELKNDMTEVTPAAFEPTIDYVVVKIPRFAFEKFEGTPTTLTTSMKSVGEVMAIGRSFAEAFQKALRSMEIGLDGLNEVAKVRLSDGRIDKNALLAALSTPNPDRYVLIAEGFRAGMTVQELNAITQVDPWFLEQIANIVVVEKTIADSGLPTDFEGLLHLKKMGFSDRRLAQLTASTEGDVRSVRISAGVTPVYKRIDTCAAEFPSKTAYMYGTYEAAFGGAPVCESIPTDAKKVIILGGGPNRIGQGIEFDYCCVHAAYALRAAGIETIMINCNPETVSTDYDTSDRLYFEPLTEEDVLAIAAREAQNGTLLGAIVQLGGQTPLKLCEALQKGGIPILGTSVDAIDLAEDRERFKALLNELNLRQPVNGIARSLSEAQKLVLDIGYPVVLRPSYVLGGRAMRIIYNDDELLHYLQTAVIVSGDSPVLIDSYLQNAIEIDVDCLADGTDVYVAGIMEHIEEAGIHSGDSSCSIPPFTLPEELQDKIRTITRRLAMRLQICGLMNMQIAAVIKTGASPHLADSYELYVLEVNPRASRTVPFVAKATGVPLAKMAALLMAREATGASVKGFEAQGLLHGMPTDYIALKEAVFPFKRFPGVDTILGPEMKSTGEVMGLDTDMAMAFAKAQLAAGLVLPLSGTVFVSVKNSDKDQVVPMVQQLLDLGFKIVATDGTAAFLKNAGLAVTPINKVLQGQPHIVDAIINGQIDFIINTTTQGTQPVRDSFSIRRSALMHGVANYTTLSEASAAIAAIAAMGNRSMEVRPLQEYLRGKKTDIG